MPNKGLFAIPFAVGMLVLSFTALADVEVERDYTHTERGTSEKSAQEHFGAGRDIDGLRSDGPFSPQADLIEWTYTRSQSDYQAQQGLVTPLWDEAPSSPEPGDTRSYQWREGGYQHSETQEYQEINDGNYGWVTIEYSRTQIDDDDDGGDEEEH